ncbi:GntR family transcriptional regulator / MocR family aminotransferase [Terribacillus halophilus]|uniref:GntR family transcriptional regulator / MocR family aminotransferase n=1 Tax=Terribacillus halophilus TaxID=361279 RepID=A0A1G6PPW6_9BACI|nr:PLP-dependent aminotransferase family protein [Terribacillus halophilus]SDC81415.1 GntR family transcriptional regulator / MocR family aminotransferase [Terribacillus halophilus]
MWFEIERDHSLPLSWQLHLQLKEKILKGMIVGGQRLPSTRSMAEQLGISRNTVVEVYEQMTAEGYLQTKLGAGTFVTDGILLDNFRLEKSVMTCNRKEEKSDYIDFRSGFPALASFPRMVWSKVAKDVYESSAADLFGYQEPQGSEELRQVIAAYLYRIRGIECDPASIIITSGATQAFQLVAKAIIEPGRVVYVEDPITKEIREILSGTGGSIHPIAVDKDGLTTNSLPRNIQHTILSVTPSHHFPLGAILPAQRRIELIQFAEETDSIILEDDYDSEFRYNGIPFSTLYSLAPHRVVYIGTFSKILSPALRIGYVIMPKHLINNAIQVKRYLDYHSPILNQVILARFIAKGHLEKHVNKMRKLYKGNRECLIRNLQKNFPEIRIIGSSSGLHIVAAFPGIEFNEKLLKVIKENGILIQGVERHAINKGKYANQLIFGYGNCNELEIIRGVALIKKILEGKM